MKLTDEQMRERYAELKKLFYEHGCDDDNVMDILGDTATQDDYWMVRSILANYQIRCSASRDGNN